MLTVENCRIGMSVVALAAITSVQGWPTAKGIVGVVKVMHKTTQSIHCPAIGGQHKGVLCVVWKGGNVHPAIHNYLTNIGIHCFDSE